MDIAAFNSLPEDLREAAMKSFVSFRDKCQAESEESEKRYLEALDLVNAREREYNSDLANQKKYEDLINLLSRRLGPISQLDMEEDEDVDDDESVTNSEEKGKKRISYGALRPKDGLLDLLKSSPVALSDQQLLEKLRVHFNIPNIPIKTVTNKLLELQAEKLIVRGRAPLTQEFINGLPEWLDENNKMPSERRQEIHRLP